MSTNIALSFGVGSMTIPMFQPTFPVSSVKLAAYRLTVYDWLDTGTVAVNGNSTIIYGSYLATPGYGTGLLPPGNLENNGFMRLDDSQLSIGALKGHGFIDAKRSEIDAISSVSTEAIHVFSSYIDVGYGAPGLINPGMQFLAPISGFDGSSTIKLENTKASLEVYFKASGNLFLFDHGTMTAHMHITGSPNIYAGQISPAFGAPFVVLSGADRTHPYTLPMVTI